MADARHALTLISKSKRSQGYQMPVCGSAGRYDYSGFPVTFLRRAYCLVGLKLEFHETRFRRSILARCHEENGPVKIKL